MSGHQRGNQDISQRSAFTGISDKIYTMLPSCSGSRRVAVCGEKFRTSHLVDLSGGVMEDFF
jgi:hypothetical protein